MPYGVDIDGYEFAKAIYHSGLQDKSVKDALKNIDETAYQKERLAFLNEKIGRKDNHLHMSLGHIAHGRQKQIILVLDNADQRNFQDFSHDQTLQPDSERILRINNIKFFFSEFESLDS